MKLAISGGRPNEAAFVEPNFWTSPASISLLKALDALD